MLCEAGLPLLIAWRSAMISRLKWIMVGVMLLAATLASAANWPQLEQRLQQWQGAKEVVLPAGVDPLEDKILAPVVEMVLEHGFAVLPSGSKSSAGLSIQVRDTSAGKRLLLQRAGDGALLAMEKLVAAEPTSAVVIRTGVEVEDQAALATSTNPASCGNPASPAVPAPPCTVKLAVTTTAQQLSVQSQSQPLTPGEVLFELDGAPLQLVSWPDASGGTDFYLLYNDCVQRAHSDGNRLELLEKFSSPVHPTRALHLDIGDLNSDGQPELAVVWAEDLRGVADGTNSLLHSWVLSATSEGLRAISQDLEGYVALSAAEGHLQKRSQYKPFTPDVFALTMEEGKLVVGETPVAQQQRLLFNQLPWPDSNRALVWNDDQRLMLVASGEDARIPGSTLLTDFGRYQGPTVSIPLRDPEYRSGFSAADRIMAKNYTLNRRMLRHADSVYTLVRARSEGMLLLGQASGADRLIEINSQGNSLAARYPFAPVEAFIVDFSIEDKEGQRAAVLLNEKADGSGKAYLRLQQAL
jgi:hypothetical protein